MGNPSTIDAHSGPQLALRPKTVDFDAVWSHLGLTAARVLEEGERAPRRIFHDSFMHVYELCTSTPDSLVDTLYANVYSLVRDRVSAVCAKIEETGDAELLHAYANAWMAYREGAKSLDKMFEYLNRQMKNTRNANVEIMYDEAMNEFDAEQPPKRTIQQLCMHQWCSLIFDERQTIAVGLRARIVGQLMEFITHTRRGLVIPVVDNAVVRTVVASLIESQHVDPVNGGASASNELYKNVFETQFIEITQDFYLELSSGMLANGTFDEYVAKTLDVLATESSLALDLYPHSHDVVMTSAQQMMVGEHLSHFNTHIDEYMKGGRTVQIGHMYDLLRTQRPLGLSSLLDSFGRYMRETGESTVRSVIRRNSPNGASGELSTAHAFVDGMLLVFDRFNALVSELFQDDKEFETALERAMTASVNYREDCRAPPRASEFLARYCDGQLRKPIAKSTAVVTDAQIDANLSRVIVLFRFVDDKDIFQKFYQKMMAQRLIHGYTFGMAMEEKMLEKLKTACGYEFTSKLQRMLTDIKLSEGLNKSFVEYIDTNSSIDDDAIPPTPLTAQILSAGSWPLPCRTSTAGTSSADSIADQSANCGVPVDLHTPLQMYVDFYQKQHTGRKLQWMFNLTTVEVIMRHLDRAYTVTMSLQQLCVLECFDVRAECTMSDVRAHTCMPTAMLHKCVGSLVDAQLLSTGDTAVADWSDETRLALNLKYTNRRTKFKIATVAAIKTTSDRTDAESVTHTVTQDRKLFIECAIVRIMKTRKLLNHNGLVQEVIRQCRPRFTAEVQSIKSIIEALIDKQYIQRTDNRDEYSYIA